ncbi:MAG: hypothetical protein PUP93_26865 [Rhizonema sp. NSF051]|nr:hypothetical protein [Rhizonema sp. NSF051]
MIASPQSPCMVLGSDSSRIGGAIAKLSLLIARANGIETTRNSVIEFETNQRKT